MPRSHPHILPPPSPRTLLLPPPPEAALIYFSCTNTHQVSNYLLIQISATMIPRQNNLSVLPCSYCEVKFPP